MQNFGGAHSWMMMLVREDLDRDMGCAEKGIERSVPSLQRCLDCEGKFEEIEAHGFGSRLCEGF